MATKNAVSAGAVLAAAAAAAAAEAAAAAATVESPPTTSSAPPTMSSLFATSAAASPAAAGRRPGGGRGRGRGKARGGAAASTEEAAPAGAASRMAPLLSLLDSTQQPTKMDGATLALLAGISNVDELVQTLSQPDGATWVQLCRELQARPELRWLVIDDRTVRFLKDVRSLTKREREMYLLVLLKEGREEPAVRAPGDARARRARYVYAVKPFGQLTRKAFCTLFDIRSKYLRNLQAHLAEHGSVIPRTHGNIGRVPNNRKLAREHVHFAEGWIREFGRRNGHPETIRIRQRVGDKVEIVRRQVLVITTSTSVSQLHKHFREAFALAFPAANCFGEETFRRILHTIDDVRIRRNPY